jgi:hypothetical protein
LSQRLPPLRGVAPVGTGSRHPPQPDRRQKVSVAPERAAAIATRE